MHSNRTQLPPSSTAEQTLGFSVSADICVFVWTSSETPAQASETHACNIKRKKEGERKGYLQDCSRSLCPRLRSDSSPASSEVLTSIVRLRFGRGDPFLDSSRMLEKCTRLGSSLAFDLLSPAARLCCLSAATSTSEGGKAAGELAFRFPRASPLRTIFYDGQQHENVDKDAGESSLRGAETDVTYGRLRSNNGQRFGDPMTVIWSLWPQGADPMGAKGATLWPLPRPKPETATVPYGRGTQSRLGPRVHPSQRRAFSRSAQKFKSAQNSTLHTTFNLKHTQDLEVSPDLHMVCAQCDSKENMSSSFHP